MKLLVVLNILAICISAVLSGDDYGLEIEVPDVGLGELDGLEHGLGLGLGIGGIGHHVPKYKSPGWGHELKHGWGHGLKHDHKHGWGHEEKHGHQGWGWKPHREFGYKVSIKHPSVHGGGWGGWGWRGPSHGWTSFYDTQGAHKHGHWGGWHRK